jgi:hypothetical protein
MHRSFREKPEGRNADHWHPEAFALFPSLHIVTALIVVSATGTFFLRFHYSRWTIPSGIVHLEYTAWNSPNQEESASPGRAGVARALRIHNDIRMTRCGARTPLRSRQLQ